MAELFDSFPHLENERIVIRRMIEGDVDALMLITNNENVYRYIPPFLYKKSRNTLLTAIRNLGGRDFDKKKMIIAGVYLREEPDRLVGLAEIFDYSKSRDMVTIGYRINEGHWRQGIATGIVSLLVGYLAGELGIGTLNAFVVPENTYSARALIAGGFVKEERTALQRDWGGMETVETDVYSYTRQPR